MKITSTQFIKSAAQYRDVPKDSLPHIAFAGRSNVGKSSLLNTLLRRKKLALTSSTPGKTRLLNFFLVNESFYFVDLPGYGYAKVSKQLRQDWMELVEDYLTKATQLKGVVVLCDLRHDMPSLDLDLLQWLHYHRIKTIVVGTKADKLSKNALRASVREKTKRIETIGLGHHVIAFSVKTGMGKADLWQEIEYLLKK